MLEVMPVFVCERNIVLNVICVYVHYRIVKTLVGGNFGEFYKANIIPPYFTQPNSRFTKVAKIDYSKFTNIFHAKTL